MVDFPIRSNCGFADERQPFMSAFGIFWQNEEFPVHIFLIIRWTAWYTTTFVRFLLIAEDPSKARNIFVHQINMATICLHLFTNTCVDVMPSSSMYLLLFLQVQCAEVITRSYIVAMLCARMLDCGCNVVLS